MAKRTYKILRFDGGINNDADARDIGDNQFADLQNVAVDEMGKIIVLGDIQTTQNNGQALSIAGVITGAGNGLFACTTDHDGLLDGTVATPGQTYYLVEDGSGVIGKGHNSDNESGTIACAANQVAMYYVDGALRIADADHAGGTVPVWRGFIEGKTYMTGAGGGDIAIAEAWYTANAEIAGCFPEMAGTYAGVCKNALMLNIQYCLAAERDWASGDVAYSFDKQATTTTFDTTYDGTSTTGTSDHEWGVALEFYEDVNGTGTWMPQNDIEYKFWITTLYDNHTQESLPQLLRMWDTNQIEGGTTFNGMINTLELSFRNGDTATAGENVKVSMLPVFKVLGSAYNFGASGVGTSNAGNQRISGVRIYWSSNEDAYTSLWQMYDAKFDEGCKVIGADGGGGGTSGYAPWTDVPSNTHGGGEHVTISSGTSSSFTNPPRYFQYDVLNAHAATDVIKVDSYKTAVVANRRVYLGNIRQGGKIHGDRMLKSPVNQFDKFPSVNNIDVAIHDGDDIVALLEYADRILQFKKNTCYIINVSGNSEYLEAEHKFKGITNPGAACRTDYGVAWANQNGCYMYDGQAVVDLLEDQGIRKINQSTWSTFIGPSTGNYHRVGFNPFKRQLVVKAGTDSAAAYIFDMITKSWTYSSSMVADSNTGSNFINDPVDGSLLIFDQGGSTIDKWADTPTSYPSIIITTKDIDFGEPAVRKKVYKAYITYKSNSTTLPTVYYDTDGNTTLSATATATTGFANTSNQWTRAEFNFGSDANSCKSIQLKISGSTHTTFEINDISFIYRVKGIK